MKVGNGSVEVVAFRVEDLDRAFLADAVADFSGVDPDGQVGGQRSHSAKDARRNQGDC